MQLIRKLNKGICFLLCVTDIFSKYAWVTSLKGLTITNDFQKILAESNREPNEILVDKGSVFYDRSLKSWVQDCDLEIYSTHNEVIFAAAERFIRTLKNKISKYMASKSKYVHINKLDDRVNKYNNTYQSAIKMKPVDVKSGICYIKFTI